MRESPQTATVSLRAAGSTLTIPAQVVASQSGNITFVVPLMAPGAVQVIYRRPGGLTNWTSATIVPAAFALYRYSAAGSARAQQLAANGSASNNGLATPARNGQAVVLWGSGLGATPASKITVTLGGVAQALLYAGRSPTEPGVDQINFRVAPGTPDGCYLPLTVTYGLQVVTSFMSKTTDGSPCAHPLQLTATDLQMLDAAIVTTSAGHAYRQESATVSVPSPYRKRFLPCLRPGPSAACPRLFNLPGPRCRPPW